MSKVKGREEINVTSEEVQDDININETPADEWQQEDKYKVLGYLTDYTYQHGLEINPKPHLIAEKTKLTTATVKECIGQLHKENLISNADNGIRVNQFSIMRKGYPVCAICGSELDFKDETVTKDDYYRVRYTCPTCKKGKAEFRTKAKVE